MKTPRYVLAPLFPRRLTKDGWEYEVGLVRDGWVPRQLPPGWALVLIWCDGVNWYRVD